MNKGKINYQIELDKTINNIKKEKKVPSLLLHSCCAPCSSYVIEYLSNYFHITVFYYNPNIDNKEEYNKRVKEQETLLKQIDTKHPVKFVEGNYDVEKFKDMAAGLEDEKEGENRCTACYALRLNETGKYAQKHHYDYFTTTLSISPLKDASRLNDIGRTMERKYGVRYLFSDFKKRNGYKRSIELSKYFDLYRQNYCGCSFSKKP